MESLAGSYSGLELGKALDRSLLLFRCQQWAGGYVPMALFTSSSCRGQSDAADGPVAVADPLNLLSDGALPAYTPALISAVRNRYDFSGSADLVARMLPTLERATDYLNSNIGSDGLFHDAGTLNWRAFDLPQEVDSYTNMAWVQALTDLAYLEEALSTPASAERHRAQAMVLADAINDQLFSPLQSLYMAGTSDSVIAQDANVRAVLAGVSANPSSTLLALASSLNSRFGPMTSARDTPYVHQYVSPFMSGWQLIALLRSGQGIQARALLEKLWGRMVDADPGTLWEAMDVNGQPLAFDRGQLDPGVTSLAHGWSAAPAYALPAYAAGLRPSAPGWQHWVVAPAPMGLHFADASIRTPSGRISASWRRAGGVLHVTVDAPPGTSGEIISNCGEVLPARSGHSERSFSAAC